MPVWSCYLTCILLPSRPKKPLVYTNTMQVTTSDGLALPQESSKKQTGPPGDRRCWYRRSPDRRLTGNVTSAGTTSPPWSIARKRAITLYSDLLPPWHPPIL